MFNQSILPTFSRILIAAVVLAMFPYSMTGSKTRESEPPPLDPANLIFETMTGDFGNIFNVIQDKNGNEQGFLQKIDPGVRWLVGLMVVSLIVTAYRYGVRSLKRYSQKLEGEVASTTCQITESNESCKSQKNRPNPQTKNQAIGKALQKLATGLIMLACFRLRMNMQK